ncbi:unnamed protein product, partial [Nesidiocoris tenuis]
MDRSLDVSIGNLVEIAYDDNSNNNNIDDFDGGPAAKKRLVFASADDAGSAQAENPPKCNVLRCTPPNDTPDSTPTPDSMPAPNSISLSSMSS